MGSALDSSWAQMPQVSRIIITGVLLTVISLTTPFWACIRDSSSGEHMNFGLFHYCRERVCKSIHDNVIEGRDVPLWFHMVQMCFFIGCVCCSIPMFVIVSSKKGNRLYMTTTMNQMLVLLMLAGVTQQFTSLYTFAAYFEHTNFLYTEIADVDFYGSYYCGVAGAIANFFGSMILFFDEDITKPFHLKPNNLLFRDFRFKKPQFIPLSQREEPKVEIPNPSDKFPSTTQRPYRNMMEQLYYEHIKRKTLLDNAIKRRNSKKNK